MKTRLTRLALATLGVGSLAGSLAAQTPSLHEDSLSFTLPRARVAAPMADEERPKLGVMVSDTPEGVHVEEVLEGSLAAGAGLQAGDVILSIDGERLGDYTDIARILARLQPGAPCAITVVREGAGLLKLEGTLPEAEKKEAPPAALADGHKGGFLGVELGEAGEHGVSVAGVIDGSAAWFAGLESGDVLTSIDGKAVATGEEIAGAVSSKAPGTLVALGFQRGDEQLTTRVRLGHRAPPPLGGLGSFQFEMPDGGQWQFHGATPFGRFFDDGDAQGMLVLPRAQGQPFVWQGLDDLHEQMQQMFPGVDLDADGAHEMKIEIRDGVLTIERDGKVETHRLDQGAHPPRMFFQGSGPHGLRVAPVPGTAPAAPQPRVKGTASTHGAANAFATTTSGPVAGSAACGEGGGSSCGGGKDVGASCPALEAECGETEAHADTSAPGVN